MLLRLAFLWVFVITLGFITVGGRPWANRNDESYCDPNDRQTVRNISDEICADRSDGNDDTNDSSDTHTADSYVQLSRMSATPIISAPSDAIIFAALYSGFGSFEGPKFGFFRFS